MRLGQQRSDSADSRSKSDHAVQEYEDTFNLRFQALDTYQPAFPLSTWVLRSPIHASTSGPALPAYTSPTIEQFPQLVGIERRTLQELTQGGGKVGSRLIAKSALIASAVAGEFRRAAQKALVEPWRALGRGYPLPGKGGRRSGSSGCGRSDRSAGPVGYARSEQAAEIRMYLDGREPRSSQEGPMENPGWWLGRRIIQEQVTQILNRAGCE